MNYGGIFGALDPNSKEADAHAERYYAFVRTTVSDIAKISYNTGIEQAIIEAVKKYLFVDEHDLGFVVKRFDPNYEIAQTWQRLCEGKNILPHDITLIRHEEYESKLVSEGFSQGQAHVLASKKYNYSQEVRDYYAAINKH